MRVALIGCGYIAGVHMAAFRDLSNVDVVAVSDIDLRKARVFASSHKIKDVFQDYIDLLEVRDLDMVDICTPVSTHARIARDAVESGCNVLVEKPMALSTSECERMIQDSEKHGTKLCVCHNRLFLPSIVQAKAMLDSGDYHLTSFKTLLKESFEVLRDYDLARNWNVTPNEKGILWEVGCHEAYLHLHFLGNIIEVYALGSKVKYPVYDEFTVLLRTSGPAFGIMEVSWVSKEQDILYEISTSDERRTQIYEEYDYLIDKSERPPWSFADVIRNLYTDEKRTLGKWMKFGVNFLRGKKTVSHFNLISAFTDSLEKDLPPPVPARDGMKTVKLLECIEESLRTQQVVRTG